MIYILYITHILLYFIHNWSYDWIPVTLQFCNKMKNFWCIKLDTVKSVMLPISNSLFLIFEICFVINLHFCFQPKAVSVNLFCLSFYWRNRRDQIICHLSARHGLWTTLTDSSGEVYDRLGFVRNLSACSWLPKNVFFF